MESNTYYRTIIDNMPDALFVCNLKGEIQDVNQTACARLGFNIDEFKELDFRNIISEKSIPEFDNKLELLIKNKHQLVELEHIDREGKLKPAELTLQIIDDNNENVILIISRDITERKQNEQKQQISEELYKKLFELANETIYIVDHRGFPVLANSHCLKLTGYTLEELISNPIINLVHPEDRAFVAKKINERLSGEVIDYAYPFRMIDKKGNIKWMYQNSIGITWNGKPAGLCVSSDITELKNVEAALRESEEKYKLLANSMHDVIFTLDLEMRYTYISPSIKMLRGYEPEEIVGTSIADTIPEEVFKDTIQFIKKELEFELKNPGVNLPHILQLPLSCKDGSIVWTEIRTSFIYDDQEKPRGIVGVTRDISSRKKAEEDLRQSEEKYRLVVENANEGIFIIQNGHIVFSNQFVRNILGYNDEELKKEHFINLIHPEDKETVFDNYKKRMEGKFIPMYITRVKKKKGDYVSVEVRATKIEYEGKPATLNFTTDITDKLKAERELKDNEERYRSFFSNSIEAISIFDTDTLDLIDVNDAFCKMYGYTKDEALTLNVADVSAEPEISEQAINASVKEGGVNIPIRYHKKKDGTIMIVRISAGPFQWKGRNVMYSIQRDITEQLKTEQELIDSKDLLQKMADSVPAYVAVVDAETLKYKFANQRFIDAYRREREQIIGVHIKDIISEKNAEFAMKYINEVRKGNSASYINIFKIDAGERYINVNYTPSFDLTGKVKDIIVLSHDITDLKNVEMQLQKAKEEAEHANLIKSELIATKNRFFSIIAHDLKSPLNGLIGLSELLITDAVEKQDYKDIATHLHDAAINGFTLLENLLDWARTQTGEIKFKPEKINLKNIVEYTISLLKQNANEKKIILSESISDEIVIEGDIQMINTILRNLISNAIKFTPKGGSVKIEAVLEKEYVNISVSDTGIGINPKGLQKLFKIDEGYSNPGTENERGTGLGLILCKEFVDKHSGSIKVESEVSKGTKIIVKLPKHRNVK